MQRDEYYAPFLFFLLIFSAKIPFLHIVFTITLRIWKSSNFNLSPDYIVTSLVYRCDALDRRCCKRLMRVHEILHNEMWSCTCRLAVAALCCFCSLIEAIMQEVQRWMSGIICLGPAWAHLTGVLTPTSGKNHSKLLFVSSFNHSVALIHSITCE